MELMLLAGLLFLMTHLGISSTGARVALVSRLGEGAYLAVFSVLALATLSYLIWLYGELPRTDYLWLPNPSLYLVPKIAMPVALILLVGGFMVKNPTNVGAAGMLEEPGPKDDLAHGVTRITRHPFQWAVIIWAVSHLAANGDAVSVIFFSTFLVLSAFGSVLLDRKKAASLGEAWAPYARQTSNVPFLAIVQGRNRLVARELILPVVVGVVVYGLLFWGHQWVSGVRIV